MRKASPSPDKVGYKRNIGLSIYFLAMVAFLQGDMTRARSLLEESLVLFHEVGERGRIAEVFASQGLISLSEGDYAAACARNARHCFKYGHHVAFLGYQPDRPSKCRYERCLESLMAMSFITGVLLLFGLVGLYLRQVQRAGFVGLPGFFLTFLGFLFPYVVASFFFMSVLPYLAPKGSTVIQDSFSTVALFGQRSQGVPGDLLIHGVFHSLGAHPRLRAIRRALPSRCGDAMETLFVSAFCCSPAICSITPIM